MSTKAPSTRDDSSGPNHSCPTWLGLLLTILGWGLVGAFVCASASQGRIGADARSFQIAYCVGFLGYLLLLLIVRAKRKPWGHWGWWLVGCFGIRALLIGVAPTDDAHRYLWEGRVQVAGFNPFTFAPDDQALSSLRNTSWESINHKDYPAIYGPVAELEFLGVAYLYPCILATKGFHVLWDALIVLVLGSCLKRLGLRPHLAIGYGLCPLVLSAFAIEGHVDSLMLLLIVMSLRAGLSDRWNMAGAALGLAIGAKIVAIVLLPWLLFHHRRAALIAVLALAASYIPYYSAGTGLFESLMRFTGGSAFFSLVGILLPTWSDAPVVRLALAPALILVLIALLVKTKRYDVYCSCAMSALLLFSPIVHYWYLTWPLLIWPFHRRAVWISGAFAMVVYFEAERSRQISGDWSMPTWAPIFFWATLLTTWMVEALVRRQTNTARQSGDSMTQF